MRKHRNIQINRRSCSTANCSAHIFQFLWLYAIHLPIHYSLFICLILMRIQCSVHSCCKWNEIHFWWFQLIFTISFIMKKEYHGFTMLKTFNVSTIHQFINLFFQHIIKADRFLAFIKSFIPFYFPSDLFYRLLFITLWIVYGHVGRWILAI